MRGTEKCPICGSFLLEDISYMDTILMEYHQECDNCKSYYFSYITGNCQMSIGVKLFNWYYNTPLEEMERIEAIIDAEIDKVKVKM